jgi:hypothetical protein
MFAGVSQKNQNRPEHTVSNRNFHCFVLNLQTILLGLSDDPEVVLAQLALVPVGLVQPDLQTVQMGQSYGALAATGRQQIPRTVAPVTDPTNVVHPLQISITREQSKIFITSILIHISLHFPFLAKSGRVMALVCEKMSGRPRTCFWLARDSSDFSVPRKLD